MSNGNTTEVVTQVSPLSQLLKNLRPRATAALVEKMDPDAFLVAIETAVRKNPKLMQCSEESLFSACAQCADLGLIPLYDLAYLIPRAGEVTLQLGYKGLIHLVRSSGQFSDVEARLVHEGDHFNYRLGLNPDIDHVPQLTMDTRIVTHAYAIAWPTDKTARPMFEVMSFEQIEHVRTTAADERSPAWRNYWGQQARKTVLRRLCNYLPLRETTRKFIEQDDETSFPELDRADAIEGVPDPQLSRTEQVRHQIVSSANSVEPAPESSETGDSIVSLEIQAGVGPSDRDALCERLGIESPVHHDEPKYTAELERLIAEQQEIEA